MYFGTMFLVLHSIVGIIAGTTCPKGATFRCCQATVAGDLPAIQFLAALANYELTPDDVNCIEREYIIS